MSEQSSLWLSEHVAGVILAGGQNRRMGGLDKAFLRVDGTTAFDLILGTLRRCFQQVVVVSNSPEKYASYDVEVTPDELRGLGPLGGMHAGLGRVRTDFAFVTACDMPFLRREPIRYLVSHLGEHEAIVPCWHDDIEPLHALYSTRLRSRISDAVGEGARAIRDFLPRVNVLYVPESEMIEVSGSEESFRNVNTPEEAARYSVQLVGKRIRSGAEPFGSGKAKEGVGQE